MTNLLRIAADGELTEQQSRRLDSHLAANPGDHEFLAFERRLRAAVGRVMGEAAAPSDLRSRIEAQLHAPVESLSLAGRAASRPLTLPALRRRHLFVPSGLAAGFLLLVGVAVLIGVTGHADWFDWFTPTKITVSDQRGPLNFPVQEHELCARDEVYAQRKFTLHTQAEVRAHITDDLHWDVSVPDLSSFGYSLHDAGDCVAGGGAADSIHLRYMNGSTPLSLWIEHSLPSELTHSADLQEGHAYYITPTNRQSLQDASRAYYAWRVSDFVYKIVPASVDNSREMAISIGMPDATPESFN